MAGYIGVVLKEGWSMTRFVGYDSFNNTIVSILKSGGYKCPRFLSPGDSVSKYFC